MWNSAALILLVAIFAAPARAADLSVDVCVYNGNPGGVAAAVAAARSGRSVLLVEPTAHVGGIVSSGLCNVDIIRKNAVAGSYAEFVESVRAFYEKTYGKDSPQYKACREGHHFEPRVAEAMFLRLLQNEGDKLQVIYKYRLEGAQVESARLVSATFQSTAAPPLTVRAKVFIDCSYEGDLAAKAGVKYQVGRESREEFGERHAGVIYTHFGKDEHLPGSTGAADAAIQAFCFRMCVTANPENREPIRKPTGYNRDDYRPLLADIQSGKITTIRKAVQFWALPNQKFEINSDDPHKDGSGPSESLDLAEEVWPWPDADYATRKKIFDRVWSYNEGYFWFLQNDEEVPEKMREETRQFGFAKDEFTDNDFRPWQVYVRQGRRIFGEYRLTEKDGEVVELERTKIQPDSIGIAEYPFDSHACHKFDPGHPGVREGYFYIAHPPIQIPYGVIVPQKIDGLLVSVACSATHVGYQTIRMEPVFMQLGQAAGTAAHIAIASNLAPRTISPAALQRRLAQDGCVVTYYSDLKSDDPDFAGFQFLGARALNPGYNATPDHKLTQAAAARKLARIFAHSKIEWNAPETSEDPLTSRSLAALVRGTLPINGELDDRPIVLRDFARIMYQAMKDLP